MGVSGYRHKYKGFYENFTFPESINRGENDHKKVAHASLVENSPLSFSSSHGDECLRGDLILLKLCEYHYKMNA